MNFAALPPEVNSGLMYTGPGSGPMLAVAGVWDGLAADLHATATAYDSVVSGLTRGPWLGPSSALMAAAVAPYVGWLSTTAAQAEKTATQAKAAAAAYETAFAMTVPPPVIATNRAQLLMLVATNVLGQNTSAIAAAEAHYAQMWAQDATAMYEYAAAAAPVAQLTPFTAPPQTTNPAGQAQQAAAVGQNTGGSAATGAQQVLSQLSSATSNVGQAAPVAAAALPVQEVLPDLLGLNALAVAGVAASDAGVALSAGAWQSADQSTRLILDEQDQLNVVQVDILNAIDLYSPLTPSRPAWAIPGHAASMSAAMGEAVSAGNLSVPLNWAAAAPELRTVAYTRPIAGAGAGVGGAPAVSMGGAGTAFGQMAVAGMGGSALAGAVSSRGRQDRVETATPAARQQSPEPPPDNPVMGIAAEIREFAALRDAGLITNEEYTEQKERLLGR